MQGERGRESTTAGLEKRERHGSVKLLFYFRNYIFLNFQLKTRKFAAKSHKYYVFSVVIYAHTNINQRDYD